MSQGPPPGPPEIKKIGISVQEAVGIAKDFLVMVAPSMPQGLWVEEVRKGEDELAGKWIITLSHAHPFKVDGGRVFKLFRINAYTGEVESMINDRE
jgi:hypothetical protein